jgi:glutamate/tyrosine decarboxylase-like PLP-dependent enzyme
LKPHLSGIELADSITCDAHKWLNVTMGAGMFFCRDKRVLDEAFRVTTDYMPGLTEGVVDNFVTSVQWSRRFIGLKLFLALASQGESGYADIIDGQAEIGDYMKEQLESEGWEHVSYSPLPVCCVSHPRIEAGERSLDDVLARVLAGGQAWISKVRLGERHALRACVTSCLTTHDDIDTLVAEMNAALAA